MVRKIVAIGGGEIGLGETTHIDRRIVQLSGKALPSLLFLPTASGDAEGYIETVDRCFSRLGCRVSVLRLLNPSSEREQVRQRILSSDIVYIGGGSTSQLMTICTSLHLQYDLHEACDQGTVLAGISAGAICLFKAGPSDSLFDESETQSVTNGWTKGFGFLPYLHCPHYDEVGHTFDKLMRTASGQAIALENGTAVVSLDGRVSIIKEKADANVWQVLWEGNRLIKKRWD
ncbi:MAG: Type 1 glutamine amidotransferase-like domain-containing protein [Sporolactobacillus sp.]